MLKLKHDKTRFSLNEIKGYFRSVFSKKKIITENSLNLQSRMAFYTPHFNEILTAKIDRIWEKVNIHVEA